MFPYVWFHWGRPHWAALLTAVLCSLTLLLWRRPWALPLDLPCVDRICSKFHVPWVEWGRSFYMCRLEVSQLPQSAWVQVAGCFGQECCRSKAIKSHIKSYFFILISSKAPVSLCHISQLENERNRWERKDNQERSFHYCGTYKQ